MTELDKLQSLLRDITPSPNPEAKAETLRLAAENFARLQEYTRATPPIPEPPKQRPLWKGVFATLNRSSLRNALYACSCLIVAGVVYTNYTGQDTLPKLDETPVVQGTFKAPANAQTPRADTNLESYSGARATPTEPPAPSSESDMSQDYAVRAAPAPTREPIAAAASRISITTEPVSTFSIDVDKASYATVRSYLLNGQSVPPASVRVQEMVNYFTYDYPLPTDDEALFSTSISVTQTPWNQDTQLVQIGIQGQRPAVEDRPPLNLVVLIDTSGPMQAPNKFYTLKQFLKLMLSEFHPNDNLAIVTYAGIVLPPTKASETPTILNALEGLDTGEPTARQSGLQRAYGLAEQMKQDGDISQILLATDGNFNVGIDDPDQMNTFIKQQQGSGTYLSVLGIGRGNYPNDMMQTLAQNGNGVAAYIDTLSEAQKVLVDQLSGAFFLIANDMKIQVEFNPAVIAKYRLIGYETQTPKREGFNNDVVDAGDIGAGHQVTVLYEITPVDSPAMLNDSLRYAKRAPSDKKAELGFFKLRYKTPGSDESHLMTTPIQTSETPGTAGFAAAIAGFAQILKGSDYTKSWDLDAAITLAQDSKGEDPFGYRAEAIRLMKLAKVR